MRSHELAVGDPARRRAGSAVYLALALVGVFGVVNWFTKETPSLDLRQPWQDDPFDVVVSLDFVALPVLVFLGVARAQLCRRYSALPSRRLVDLLRVCRAAVGACLITQAAEWIAVALRLHRASWNTATLGQIIALLVGTVAMVTAGARLRAASRAVLQASDPAAQPDWLADTTALGFDVARKLRRFAPCSIWLVGWVDRRLLARIRERPVAASMLVAAALALPFVIAKIVLEGYPPALALFSFLLPAMALFALIVIAGRYLRIVTPRSDLRPAGATAAVAACLTGPALFAFHDSLLPQHQTVAELYVLLVIGSIIGGLATLLAVRAMDHIADGSA